MKEEIMRVLKECENNKWITISPHLRVEALAGVFVDLMKDIKLKDYLDIFTPKF